MRILITGGAGFLGSHLCDFFLDKKNYVIALDNLITGREKNLAHIKSKNFSFIKHDISEPFEIHGKIDAILHFASPASPIDYLKLPLQTMKAGAFGTYNVLELARKKKAKFLIASTSEVYGDPLVHPQKEEYWGNVNSVGPRSVYDESKRFSEALTMAYHRQYKLDTRIARIFNTYGTRMRTDDGRVVPTFIVQALQGKDLTVFGTGNQTRSFCYVDDLVEGIYRLLLSDYHMPVNLGNPEEFKIIELAKKVISMTGSKSKIMRKPLPEDDPAKRKPDISKAKKLLNWKPKVSLDEGLSLSMKEFLK